MKPQENNKPKAPFEKPAVSAPGVQKSDAQKQYADPNIKSGSQDKDRKDGKYVKPTDKDAAACRTEKGSCGTK